MLRVVLTNIKTQFTIEDNDPVGINELVLQIKRSDKNDGIFFEVIVGLKFIKEAIPFLENSFRNYGGVDALVLVTVYEYDPNTRIWEVYQEGTINFNRKSKSNNYFETAIEQVSPQTMVMNAFSSDVDLGGGLDITLHSKKLVSMDVSIFNIDAPTELLHIDALVKHYALFDRIISVKEIEDAFIYPNQINVNSPVTELKFIHKAKHAGDYTYTFNGFTTYRIDGVGTNWQVGDDFTYKLVYGKPGAYTTIVLNTFSWVSGGDDVEISFTSLSTITLEINDEVYLYTEFDVSTDAFYVVFPFLITDTTKVSNLSVSALTSSAESSCNGVLLFEAVELMLQQHSNNTVLLRSTLLGRTDLDYTPGVPYDADGDASLIVWTNGNAIRQLTNKKIFANLEQVLKFINSAFCASFGFEFEDNQWYLRVEKRDYFFDNTDQVVRLAGQYDFEERLIDKMYYKQVIYGYSSKIDLKQVNAIDDFNTLRKIATPITNTKNVFDITTDVRANGSEIEYQRRRIGLSEDSKLDDQNFVIVVVRDGGDFKSKKMEGYDSITGVYDESTGYNYDICPARMLKNWYSYLAANVIYSVSKSFTFSSGEGNYQASTTKTGEDELLENGDVDLTDEIPLFELSNYLLNDAQLNRSQLTLLKENPFGYLTFANKDNVLYHGFIDSQGVEHNSNEGKASIQLLKAYKVI